jgi:tetratricopeptide (TPR) repeat protein
MYIFIIERRSIRMDEEPKYSYSTEELDEILRKMEKGITPLISDDMMKEVQLRKKEVELLSQGGDDDDIEEYLSEVEKHKKLVEYLNDQKHKATKTEAYVYTMTADQLKEIEEDMSISFVRENPKSPYNKSASDMKMSEEKREILTKLSKLRNCYYNQKDYQEAIETIRQAIEISLKTDYPWLSPEKALEKFRKGEIVYSYGALPKIYLNYITPVTDPETAKKIATGEITLVDKSEQPHRKKRRVKEPVKVPIHDVSDEQIEKERQIFERGYDTPCGIIFKSNINAYGRFNMPNSGYFQEDINSILQKEREDILANFDWLQPNAGEKYYNLLNNINEHQTVYQFLDDMQKMGNIQFNSVINNNISDFLNSIGHPDSQNEISYNTNTYDYVKSVLQPNQQALAIEEELLENIRNSNT